MIKALSEPKSETKPKPEAKPKLERRINKRKLGEFRKDFDELRHKFSRREIQDSIETLFITLKNTNIFLYQK